MEVRNLPDKESYRRMTTLELRRAFMLDNLFRPGKVSMVYCDADRAIVGGAVPEKAPLKLHASKKEMAAEVFTDRRELGIINIGGAGSISLGDSEFVLRKKDMLYVGKGAGKIEFTSAHSHQPAIFYFVSFPAHASLPATLIRARQARPNAIGSRDAANRRTIYKYIHPDETRSCQLVMGLTELEKGSVWNTMPPHTHQRRTEVYLYFGLDPDSLVVHLMGTPDETRHLIVRNNQAIISPSWSIHSGAATRKYSFIWAMGGENQDFADMDGLSTASLS